MFLSADGKPGIFASVKHLILLVLAILSPHAHAAAFTPEKLDSIAKLYLDKQTLPILEKGFSMEEALTSQAALVNLLKPKLGPVAGYKIGLITKQGQERMGATGPVHGVLLKSMLLENNATVSPRFGARPSLELDMGVIVKSTAINDAKTLAEAIPHLGELVCFIELVDSITATNQVMDGPLLTALNVGARAGVLGEKRKIDAALVAALPNIKMTLTDDSGAVIAEVLKLNLQPLDNIPWLVADLKKSATSLKAGDFISLGSPAPTQPLPAGKKVTLRYEELPGGPMTAAVKISN